MQFVLCTCMLLWFVSATKTTHRIRLQRQSGLPGGSSRLIGPTQWGKNLLYFATLANERSHSDETLSCAFLLQGERLKLSLLADDVTDEADLAGLGLLSGSGLSLSDVPDLTMHLLDCHRAQHRPVQDIFCCLSTIALTDSHFFISTEGRRLTWHVTSFGFILCFYLVETRGTENVGRAVCLSVSSA